jgi:hypothetical protein
MPAKRIKTASGRIVEVKAIRLPNGNLLVPRRNRAENRAEWAEVAPGSPEFKRWLPVAVDEADPR